MSLKWLFVPILAVLIASCGDAPKLSEVEKIQKSGKLRVGIDPGYLPFEMKTTDGRLIGFDIELAQAIAESLGVQVDFRDVEWDGIIPALKAGDIDMICSGMSITDERKQTVLFSDAYYEIGQAVLLPKASEGKVTKISDLNHPDAVIAVQTGTTGEKAAREALPNAKIKGFDKQVEAAMEVKEGRAAAMVFDHPFVAIFHKRHASSTAALLEPFTKEAIGIALRPQAKDLKAKVDATVAAMRKDGRMAALEKKYFVDMPWLQDIGGE